MNVFERICQIFAFGCERAEVKEHWRKLHNEECYNVHSSPVIFRMKKSRRIGWIGHVACIG
jgi:hypothetical protein